MPSASAIPTRLIPSGVVSGVWSGQSINSGSKHTATGLPTLQIVLYAFFVQSSGADGMVFASDSSGQAFDSLRFTACASDAPDDDLWS